MTSTRRFVSGSKDTDWGRVEKDVLCNGNQKESKGLHLCQTKHILNEKTITRNKIII